MAFLETPRFPTSIRYGVAGGPGFSTTVVVNAAGYELRIRNWANARGKWQLEHGPHNQADTDTLVAFFRSVGGQANGFRFRDNSDHSATTSNGLLGAGVGAGMPTYQLVKLYASGALFEYRPIRKPVSATIYRGGTPVTAGGSSGNYALDITTGIVTFVAYSSSTASSITVGATTQVVLAGNPGTLTAGKLLYLSGFTGADAGLVNGIAHTINSISGSGPYTFILATVTTGKTITLGSGSGSKYPQASDVLTWAGEFDVPVRFGADEMTIEAVDIGLFSWHQVQIMEIRV